MEGDHDLAQQNFRNNPNCNWYKFLATTRCSLIQQPSLSPSPQAPKSQVQQEARRPWTPWTPWCSLVRCPNRHESMMVNITHHSFMPSHSQVTGAPGCRLCSTVLLTDPAAAEFLVLSGCRSLMR